MASFKDEKTETAFKSASREFIDKTADFNTDAGAKTNAPDFRDIEAARNIDIREDLADVGTVESREAREEPKHPFNDVPPTEPMTPSAAVHTAKPDIASTAREAVVSHVIDTGGVARAFTDTAKSDRFREDGSGKTFRDHYEAAGKVVDGVAKGAGRVHEFIDDTSRFVQDEKKGSKEEGADSMAAVNAVAGVVDFATVANDKALSKIASERKEAMKGLKPVKDDLRAQKKDLKGRKEELKAEYKAERAKAVAAERAKKEAEKGSRFIRADAKFIDDGRGKFNEDSKFAVKDRFLADGEDKRSVPVAVKDRVETKQAAIAAVDAKIKADAKAGKTFLKDDGGLEVTPKTKFREFLDSDETYSATKRLSELDNEQIKGTKGKYRSAKGKQMKKRAAKLAVADRLRRASKTMGQAENMTGEASGDVFKDANTGAVKALSDTGKRIATAPIRKLGQAIGNGIKKGLGTLFRLIAQVLLAIIAAIWPVILVLMMVLFIVLAIASFWASEKQTDVDVPIVDGTISQQIWGGMMSKGYSDEAAAALIGNAYGESDLEPDYNDGETYGLFGFSSSEFEELQKFAEENNRDWTEVSVQLSFFLHQHPSFDAYTDSYDVDVSTEDMLYSYFIEDEDEPSLETRQFLAEYYLNSYRGEDFLGSDIVSFATQYVGNAYRFGGNNLNGHIPGEDGIDCSHFVFQVLTRTGHYKGDYVTSDYWITKGFAVEKEDLKPGDIAVYHGHVAIIASYEGGDYAYIVHAKGKKYGIVYERVNVVTYHGVGQLLGFRRF